MAPDQQHRTHAFSGRFLQLNASDSFKEMFFIIIQLGAILAVVVLYWNRMFPFQFKDKAKPVIRKDIFSFMV